VDEVKEPKRRDAAKTKARILTAANAIFSEHGYAQAGLREIAQEAGVASSLVLRYYQSKARLFEAALVDTIANNSVFTLEKRGFGQRMAQLMSEQTNVNITTMLVLALGDPESKAVVERVSRTHLIEPLAAWLGTPEPLERALDLFSLMTGFVILLQSQRSGTIPLASIQRLATTLQQIVDEGAH
jgi:AcrR family transcriptional regulator